MIRRYLPAVMIVIASFCILPPAVAQEPSSAPIKVRKRVVRIPVRSANPWFIKALLEGQPVVSPEFTLISQIFGLPPSFGQSVGNAMSSLVKNGYIQVNPTDNSILFYPDF